MATQANRPERVSTPKLGRRFYSGLKNSGPVARALQRGTVGRSSWVTVVNIVNVARK